MATKLVWALPSTAESKITTGMPAATAFSTSFCIALGLSGASAMPSTPRLTMFSMIFFCSAISVSVSAPSHLMLTPSSLAASLAPTSTVSQNSPPVLLGITAKVSDSFPAPADPSAFAVSAECPQPADSAHEIASSVIAQKP